MAVVPPRTATYRAAAGLHDAAAPPSAVRRPTADRVMITGSGTLNDARGKGPGGTIIPGELP